jgi:cell division protein ZapB
MHAPYRTAPGGGVALRSSAPAAVRAAERTRECAAFPARAGAPRSLTRAAGAAYSPAMNDPAKGAFEAELRKLEKRVDELMVTVSQLKEENRALRQRQDTLTAERSALLQKNEQVRARVEAMIGRLKSMEHGT